MGLEYIYIMGKLDVIDLWVVAELESLFTKVFSFYIFLIVRGKNDVTADL